METTNLAITQRKLWFYGLIVRTCLNKNKGTWLVYDDLDVEELIQDQVNSLSRNSKEAYILFYESK